MQVVLHELRLLRCVVTNSARLDLGVIRAWLYWANDASNTTVDAKRRILMHRETP